MMRCYSIVASVMISLALASTLPAQMAANHYNQLRQASVGILVQGRLQGSGSIVHRDGSVLTAAHVVPEGTPKVEILSHWLGRLPARIVALDPGHDLALLQLPPRKGHYPHLELARQPPGPGSRVHLLGTPLYRHDLLLGGTVAREETGFEFVNGHYIEIQYLAAATPGGSSGGPWVNSNGQLFGVQSSAMILANAPQGVAFAAPLPAIHTFVQSQRSTAPATLGSAFEETWEQPAAFVEQLQEGTEGLVIRVLKPHGPLAKVGAKEGEIVISINGHKVRWRDQLLRHVRAAGPATTVKLTIADSTGKEQREVHVETGSLARDVPASIAPKGRRQ